MNKQIKRKVFMELPAEILAIDSDFEPVTEAAFQYRQQNVYPYFEGLGFAVIRCQESLARRIYAAPEACKTSVLYITGVGHGTYSEYTGYYYDPIFRIKAYQPAETKGKIVHFLSCQTAAGLGPDFVLNGCRAYFGYDENFTLLMETADIFFECDSEIDRAFAERLSAGEVYDRVQAIYNKKISELEVAGHDYIASTLEFDRDHLKSPSVNQRWGDKKAKLLTLPNERNAPVRSHGTGGKRRNVSA